MTSDAFRKLALALPETTEGSHMGHADFRTGGKIFASLPDEDGTRAMVKLTPEEQEAFMESDPDHFSPCAGAWGMGGATYIALKGIRTPVVKRALKAAWDARRAK